MWTYAALLAGQVRDHDHGDQALTEVHLETIGDVNIPDGAVVAADPYLVDGAAVPFGQRLAGEHATVVVARLGAEQARQRILALSLVVASGDIVEWVMATRPGQDVGTLEDGHFFGCGVDAGFGAFGGVDAMLAAGEVLAEDCGMLVDPISQALFSDGGGTSSAVVVAPGSGLAPIAVCSSGWGDGQYPTWLGVDQAGDVVVAVTDFLTVGDPYLSES